LSGSYPDYRFITVRRSPEIDDADVVDVWLVDGRSPHPELESLYELLDSREKSRADGCLSGGDRREYVVAHAAVRCIVGERLGIAPTLIRWETGPHGKPELGGGGEHPRVNLSHSGELCMVAVTSSRGVGVDVQRVATGAVAAMARRYYPPAEARLVLDAADAEEQSDLFARLWVRKEALVKAAGSRLTRGLAAPVHEPAPMTVDFRADGAPGLFRVADLEAPKGYQAAIALSGAASFKVVQRSWSWPTSRAARQRQLCTGS
jgi:4'-phosphopantetheinyl transferase